MSEVKVNKVSSRTGNAVTLGNSGDTLTVPSGVTITSAGTVSGGFKDIQWQSVITADGSTNTTAEAGKGYIIDTSSNTHTINLPASPSAGDQVAIIQSGSNAVTVGRNGSNIVSSASDLTLANSASAILVYSGDSSIGWVKSNNDVPDTFIEATGGTETTSGDFKIHTFTSSGCFTVSQASNSSTNNEVSYMVVAGGGGGGSNNSGQQGGGGGAGGFRESKSGIDTFTASPIEGSTPISLTATTYPITVGAGGATVTVPTNTAALSGSNSVFSTITSAGGGGGGTGNPGTSGPEGEIRQGRNGGSGGGSAGSDNPALSGGSGNTPPVSPSQGFPGGAGTQSPGQGGSGGGATAAGDTSTGLNDANAGGSGATTNITASPVEYGIGGSNAPGPSPGDGTAGTANRGNGGGGSSGACGTGASGGSGIVVIRYKYQ